MHSTPILADRLRCREVSLETLTFRPTGNGREQRLPLPSLPWFELACFGVLIFSLAWAGA